MTQNVHVIYREAVAVQADVPCWTSYSYPDSIYAAGLSLEQMRTEFLDAARFHVNDVELRGVSLFEHVETPLVEGVYVRVAVDRRTLDRDAAVAAVRRSFTVAHQLADFTKSALVAATGDAVIVACTPADRLGWLFEQMGPHDALQICVVSPGGLVWWSAVAHLDAFVSPSVASQPTIADLGLNDSSTVADLMRLKVVSDHRPVRVSAVAHYR
ncbi:MAG: hypothetical protein ACT4NY_34060 [Pseudonocardiales bacterium]